ncbi:hypothetical protein QZH41_020070 [Actinostola sp. cb2023]|nr:hypothetical protein QZH41_020070 [Actinostola sp. cb2023]
MFRIASCSCIRLLNAQAFEQCRGFLSLYFRFKSGPGNTMKGTRKLQIITQNWIKKLKKHGVPEAELSVKYIVQKALAQSGSRKDGLRMMYEISTEQQHNINTMCGQRLNREPIQYIIGDWDFRHLTLNMKPPVFIPRPETEASCVAIDTNPDAVALTQLNGTRYNLQDRLTVVDANIGSFYWNNKFDAIICNPPYIPRNEMEGLEPEVNRYEDENALCGGDDGLDVIRMIFTAASNLLKPYGSIWLELDLSHPPLVTKLLQDNPSLGLQVDKFYNDFTNR